VAQVEARRDRVVNVLPFVIRLRELIEDGQRHDGSLPGYVVHEITIVLEGLENDLWPKPDGVRCQVCGAWFEWAGLRDAHMYGSHWDLPADLAEAA
jgi:hypothetical protein